MSLTQGTGANSSPDAVALGEALSFFGSIADYAAGEEREVTERAASLAVALGRLAELSPEECDALYFAARLRNCGALGNPAFDRHDPPPERIARMQRTDIPAAGARLCETFAALPHETADVVRWQSERWDGTGYPDQLRWGGIPKPAQLLHVAKSYAEQPDGDDAFERITMLAGQAFAPEQIRTFTMWYHTCAGEIGPLGAPPYGALDALKTSAAAIVDALAERVDAHNGTPGRAQRIAALVDRLAARLDLDDASRARAHDAALLFAIGELRAPELEAAQFDPLARLGNGTRAAHAVQAAALVERSPHGESLARVMRARAEWFDGTGGPDGLRHGSIPREAHLLAVAIGYDAMEESYRSRITQERTLPIARLETAAGTQFDPQAIRALESVLKANA